MCASDSWIYCFPYAFIHFGLSFVIKSRIRWPIFRKHLMALRSSFDRAYGHINKVNKVIFRLLDRLFAIITKKKIVRASEIWLADWWTTKSSKQISDDWIKIHLLQWFAIVLTVWFLYCLSFSLTFSIVVVVWYSLPLLLNCMRWLLLVLFLANIYTSIW